MPKNAVLSIWYNKKSYPQGKFFCIGKTSYFIANIDEAKLFRTFNGWAISKRILDKFSELKLRKVTIIYRFVTKKTLYITVPSTFTSKGILVAFGGHSQYVLPIKNWKVQQGDFTQDPKDLPVMDLEKWVKSEATPEYRFVGNKAMPVEEPVQERMFA